MFTKLELIDIYCELYDATPNEAQALTKEEIMNEIYAEITNRELPLSAKTFTTQQLQQMVKSLSHLALSEIKDMDDDELEDEIIFRVLRDPPNHHKKRRKKSHRRKPTLWYDDSSLYESSQKNLPDKRKALRLLRDVIDDIKSEYGRPRNAQEKILFSKIVLSRIDTPIMRTLYLNPPKVPDTIVKEILLDLVERKDITIYV